MATIFRSPIITRREPARGIVEQFPPNLLLTTLKSKDAFPPGKLYDFPNPRGYVPAILLRTHLDPLKLPLLGKDKFFGAPGQVPNYDWQNPRGYIPAISLRTHTDPLKLLLRGKDNFPPGKLYDWPNPRGPLFPSDLRTYLNPVELQLIGKDNLPTGKLYDFPNPLRRLHPISLFSWEENLQTSTLAPVSAVPFHLIDWPLPVGATYSVGLRTWTQELKLNLLGQDTVLRQAVIGRLERARWPMPEQVQNFLPIIFIKPFNLSDWPVPPGYRYPISLRSWTEAVKLNLIGQDAFPSRMSDWPNPLAPRATISLRTFTAPLNPNLPPPTPPTRSGRLLYNLDTGQLEWMVSATAPGAPILVINL